MEIVWFLPVVFTLLIASYEVIWKQHSLKEGWGLLSYLLIIWVYLDRISNVATLIYAGLLSGLYAKIAIWALIYPFLVLGISCVIEVLESALELPARTNREYVMIFMFIFLLTLSDGVILIKFAPVWTYAWLAIVMLIIEILGTIILFISAMMYSRS